MVAGAFGPAALQGASLKEFRAWVAEECRLSKEERLSKDTDGHGQTRAEDSATPLSQPESVPDREGPCESVSVRVAPQDFGAVCAANGALSLLNLCIHLVKRQMEAQAKAFEEEGGFTERLYRIRQARRGSS